MELHHDTGMEYRLDASNAPPPYPVKPADLCPHPLPSASYSGPGLLCFTVPETIAPHLEPAVNTKAPRAPCFALLRSVLMVTGAVGVLGACSARLPNPYNAQQALPEAIRVPAGHKAVLEAQGKGDLLYECQAIKRAPYEYAWLLQSPGLRLQDSNGQTVTYFPGLRSRWVHSDGSRVVAQELVEVSADRSSLPLQRAMVSPSDTPGALSNVSYIQSRRTAGGVVSNPPCTSASLGMRVSVPFEADYVFWRPAA